MKMADGSSRGIRSAAQHSPLAIRDFSETRNNPSLVRALAGPKKSAARRAHVSRCRSANDAGWILTCDIHDTKLTFSGSVRWLVQQATPGSGLADPLPRTCRVRASELVRDAADKYRRRGNGVGEARKIRITEENGENGRGDARRKMTSEGGAVCVNERVG